MAITDSVNCACSDTTGHRTLLQLRQDMIRRLGWGAQVANPPPGVADLCNSFLQEAQRLVIKRTNFRRMERFFSWPLTQSVRKYDFPGNAEAAVIATPVAPTLSTSGVGGTLAAGTYSYRISAINANGETLASTAATQVTVGATSTVTVTFPAVVPIASGGSAQTGWKVYGRSAGTELLIASVGLVANYVDTGSVTPAGALPTTNTTYLCNKLLDPDKVTWVGIERDGIYQELCAGIPPELYTHNLTSSWPERYEFRQCIEIWPEPDETTGNLIVKGDFGVEPFEADSDRATVNDDLVFLLALANAKAHYRQPDANNYVQQFETLLDNVVSGTHTTKRYIPGYDARDQRVYVYPKPSVPFA